MGKGFVRIPLRLFETKWWNEKRVYSESDAIIDLYQSADRNNMIIGSRHSFADRWLWDEFKVYRFLERLAKEGYISLTKDAIGTSIKIIDFGATAQPTAQPTAQQSAQQQKKKCTTETTINKGYYKDGCTTISCATAQPTAQPTAQQSAHNNNIYRYIDNNIPPISPKGEREKSSKFVKPSVEDIQAYITEKGYDLNAQQIFDHYEMVGWVYGKGHNPVKDWKAAVRTWNNYKGSRSSSLPIGFNLKDNSPNKYDNDIPGW